MTTNVFSPAPAYDSIDFTKTSIFTATITPAIAEEYLAASSALRNSQGKALGRIVTDVRSGNFQYTGDTIKFSPEGTIVDGTARLEAVIRTNTALEMAIATGVSELARHVIDTGKVFTLKQSLELAGVDRPAAVAAALKAIQSFERGDHLPDRDVFSGETTNPGSLEFLRKNPSVSQIALEASKLSRNVPGLNTGLLSRFFWEFDKVSRDARTTFFSKLSSGANSGENDPIYVLRSLLETSEEAGRSIGAHQKSALVVKAWNAFRDGRVVRELKFIGGGTKPEPFPVAR